MNLGSDLAVDGNVRAMQASQAGECVTLGDDLKIPAEFMPGDAREPFSDACVYSTWPAFYQAFQDAPDGALVTISGYDYSYTGRKHGGNLYGTGTYMGDRSSYPLYLTWCQVYSDRFIIGTESPSSQSAGSTTINVFRYAVIYRVREEVEASSRCLQ